MQAVMDEFLEILKCQGLLMFRGLQINIHENFDCFNSEIYLTFDESVNFKF